MASDRPESASTALVDGCFNILTETEEILAHVREIFRGLAQGRDTLTAEKAAAIATVIERARQDAAARLTEYKRLHDHSAHWVM